VVVRHLLLSQVIAFTSFTESFLSPDRMVTFSVALLLFGFVISNLWTQLFVALTSFPLLTFTLWCLSMCWDSSSDGEVPPTHLKYLFNIVESIRKRPVLSTASLASDDGSSRHSPRNSQGDVSGVGV
jgi:hypothetical protein